MSVPKRCTATPNRTIRTAFGAGIAVLFWAAGVSAQSLDPEDQNFWAGAPALDLPLACDFGRGKRCRIAGYVDHDLSEGVSDYQCRGRSYNAEIPQGLGHSGTDLAVLDWKDWADGAPVPVIASAAGVVRNIRDEIADDDQNSGVGSDRACGNAVVVDHGAGWLTQYCHLQKDSVRVKTGDVVAAGQALGTMGSSGWSSFPHVHFAVLRQVGASVVRVDPFTSTTQFETCRRFRSTMWTPSAAEALGYTPVDFIKVGFVGTEPNTRNLLHDLRMEEALSWSEGQDIWVVLYAGGIAQGDLVQMQVLGPDGQTLFDATVKIGDQRYRIFRAGRLKTSTAVTERLAAGQALPTGRFTLRVNVANVAKRIYARKQASAVIAP